MKRKNNHKSCQDKPPIKRLVVWSFVLSGALWLLSTNPISPLAMGHADALLGQGKVSEAAALYDRISLVSLSSSDRERALERVAFVYLVELNDPDSARWRLDRLNRIAGLAKTRARALEGIGEIILNHQHNPGRAGDYLIRSFNADQDNPKAGQRLALAGRAYLEAANSEGALDAFRQLATLGDEYKEMSALSKAEVYLSLGQAETALPIYKEVAESDISSPQNVEFARFGVVTCLERMGDLSGAIAELDQADLPDDIVDARLEAMLSRSDERLR